MKDLKSDVSEILQGLRVYEGFPKVMEDLLHTIKGQWDRTADASFTAAGDGSQVNFSPGNNSRRLLKDTVVIEGVAAGVNDSSTRELSSRKRGFEETCSEEDLTVNDVDGYVVEEVAINPLTGEGDGGVVGVDEDETEDMTRSHCSSAGVARGNHSPKKVPDDTFETSNPAGDQGQIIPVTTGAAHSFCLQYFILIFKVMHGVLIVLVGIYRS